MKDRIDRLLPNYYLYKSIHTAISPLCDERDINQQLLPNIIEMLSLCLDNNTAQCYGLTVLDSLDFEKNHQKFSTTLAKFIKEARLGQSSHQDFLNIFSILGEYAANVRRTEFKNLETIKSIGQYMGLSIGSSSGFRRNSHYDRVVSELKERDENFKLEVPRLEIWYDQIDPISQKTINESIIAHLLLNEFSGKWQAFINYKKLSDTYVGELGSFDELVHFFGRVRAEIDDFRFYIKPEDICG